MPNWCEGNMKIRGTKENIVKFLEEGIEPVGFMGDKLENNSEIKDYEEELEYIFSQSLYVHGTRRGFFKPNYDSNYKKIATSVWGRWFEEGGKGIFTIPYKQAWGFDAREFKEISQKYDLDFKILGFECGMEFNLDMEIVNGEIVKFEEIKFDDYEWECINPNMGG